MHALDFSQVLADDVYSLYLVYTCVVVIVATLMLVAARYWRTAVGSQRPYNIPLKPGSIPILGHTIDLVRNQHRFHDWILEGCKQTGFKTHAFTAAAQPTWVVVTDPTCLEHILRTEMHNYVKGYQNYICFEPILGHGIFSSDGGEWQWQRKLATNIFSVRSFKRYIDLVFSQEMEQITSLLSQAAASVTPIDLHDLMYRFTLDSFGQIGFGVNLGCMTSKGKVPFAVAFDLAQVYCVERFTFPGWQVIELLNGRRRTLNHCTKVVRSFAMDIINKRRQQQAAAAASDKAAAGVAADTGHTNGHAHTAAATATADEDSGAVRDLLSLFMEAAGPSGKPLTDQQLVDTVINFIIAGRDTTAQALSWTFYELMQHPDVEAKLLQEIQGVLGPDITESSAAVKPSYDQIKELRYTRACFLEALRLHPSVPEDIKNTVKKDVLPDGSIVAKGARILYSPYAVNRMTSFWGPDAEEFRPDRWLELRSMPSPYSYLSFNAGPRLCLGQRLAEIEGVYVLAGLLAKFRFKQAVTGSKVGYVFSTSLPMREGLQVLVHQRKAAGPAPDAEE